METALGLLSTSSLMTILNVIIVGVIIYWATNKFVYIINVVIYAIAKSVIPIVIKLILAGMIGSVIEVSIGEVILSMLILCIPFFVIGLAVIKIVEKIIDWFNADTIQYFIVSFTIIDSIISSLFIAFLRLFIK